MNQKVLQGSNEISTYDFLTKYYLLLEFEKKIKKEDFEKSKIKKNKKKIEEEDDEDYPTDNKIIGIPNYTKKREQSLNFEKTSIENINYNSIKEFPEKNIKKYLMLNKQIQRKVKVVM